MRWAHHATPHTAAALPTSGVLVVAGGGWNAVSDGSCCGLGSRPSVDCAPSSAGPNRTGKGALPVCISCSATCVFPFLAVQRCLLTIQLMGVHWAGSCKPAVGVEGHSRGHSRGHSGTAAAIADWLREAPEPECEPAECP
jgi:hypothetical protein